MKASKLTRMEIAREADELAPGMTSTIVCPECDGGSSGQRTLSITKKETGQVGFICFRDSCQIKGYLKASGYTPVEKEVKVKKPREVKVEKLMAAQNEDVPTPTELLVQEKYNVSLSKHYCRWDSTTERVLMPIFDEYIELRGYVARSYSGAEPKALTYKEVDYAGAGWTQVGFAPTETLVVVEDPVSAMAIVDLGVDAVALLGTNLSDEVVTQIDTTDYKRVYVALDYDALTKCIENSKKIKNATVIRLEKDVKDMSLEERAAWLKEINGT
jgi:hypothetical protein